MPKISVVMPVYNAAVTLPRAIDSILSQTCHDFEFIIVNEFESNDGSREIIEDYARKDNRVRLLQLREHKGYAESLNLGIRAAMGEYVAIMDADDYSYPERLEKQNAFMDENTDYVMCGTYYRVVYLDGRTSDGKVPITSDEIKVNLIFSNSFVHPSVFFRREVFKQNGWFYKPKYRCEDLYLWTEIDGKMVNIPEVMIDYHIHGTNATILFKDEVRRDTYKLEREQLRRRLGIATEKYEDALFSLEMSGNSAEAVSLVTHAAELLLAMDDANERCNEYHDETFHRMLCERWKTYLRNFWAVFAFHEYSVPFVKYHCGLSFSSLLAAAMGITKGEIVSEIGRRCELAAKKIPSLKKIAVFGTGRQAKSYFSEYPKHLSCVSDFIDNNPDLWGKEFCGKTVNPPRKLASGAYDWIVIAPSLYFEEICDRLKHEFSIDRNKISDLGILKFLNF